MKHRTSMSKAFLLIISMLLIVSACSNNTQEPAPTTNTENTVENTEANEAKAPELEPVELIMYLPAWGVNADQQLVEDEINKITQAKINATIKLKPIEIGNYDQKMNTIVAANENFDIAWTSNWSFKYGQNVSKGAFLPLDKLLDEYAPNLKKSIPSFVWDATRVKGEIFAVPSYQTVTSKEGFIIQKALAEKYNLDTSTLKKLQDIEPFLAQLKANEPDITPVGLMKYGIFDSSSGTHGMFGAGSIGRIYMTDKSLKVFNAYESPEFKQYVNMMRDWYNKGYINKDAPTATKLEGQKLAKYAIQFHNVLKPGGEAEAKSANGTDMIFVPTTPPFVGTDSIITTMNAISHNSKNPERAMMFLELLNSQTDKEVYRLLSYGIKDKHYTQLDENIIRTIKDSGYGGIDWAHGSVFNGFLLEGKDPTVWELTKKENESATHFDTLGFSLVTDSITAEIANITSVMDEYLPGLVTGAVNPEKYLPEFLSRLKQAGSDKIIAEIQSQLDTWKTTKK